MPNNEGKGGGDGGGRAATPVTKRNVRADRMGENSVKFTTKPVRLGREGAFGLPGNGVAPRNESLRRR